MPLCADYFPFKTRHYFGATMCTLRSEKRSVFVVCWNGHNWHEWVAMRRNWGWLTGLKCCTQYSVQYMVRVKGESVGELMTLKMKTDESAGRMEGGGAGLAPTNFAANQIYILPPPSKMLQSLNVLHRVFFIIASSSLAQLFSSLCAHIHFLKFLF